MSAILAKFLLLASFPCVLSGSTSRTKQWANSDSDWAIAIHKGTRLFRQLQGGCYPDKFDPPTREELEAKGYLVTEFDIDDQKQWPPRFTSRGSIENDEILELLGFWDKGHAFWRASVVRECKRTSLSFPSSSHASRVHLISSLILCPDQ